MRMVVKESIERGTRKRFQMTITDLGGTPQDPNTGTCFVRLEKVGSYDYGSPTEWYLCSKVGGDGVFGADVWLNNYMTLGDWNTRFKWEMGVPPDDYLDDDSFPFTVIRRDKPYDNRRGPVL